MGVNSSHKMTRLAFEAINGSDRRLLELLTAGWVGATQKVQLAEYAIRFRQGIDQNLSYPAAISEPSWPDIPWWSKWIRRCRFEREVAKFESKYALIAALRQAMALSQISSTWLSANGSEFEVLTAAVFRKHDFDVIQRGGSGDGGIDLEVSKNGATIIVQCKAHRKPVSPSAIRDFYGTIVSSGADFGMFVTKAGVSQQSFDWAKGKPIFFLNVDDLISAKHPIFTLEWRGNFTPQTNPNASLSAPASAHSPSSDKATASPARYADRDSRSSRP